MSQLLEELCDKQKQEIKMQEELADLKESLISEKQKLAEVTSECERLRLSCKEKDSDLQVSIFNFSG